MINPDPKFWANRKVLITGHTGFKGSWLSTWLHALGADVTGYSLEPPTDPSMFELLCLREHLNDVTGDVRDLDRLSAAVRSAAPTVIFHLAAQSLVRPSYEDPIGTYTTNVMGTANVLQAARSTPGLEALVVVTSDKCYADRGDKRHHTEDDPMGGYDPYSNSKGCAELVTSAFRSSYFDKAGAASNRSVGIATTRAGNVIGGGDWAIDRLIPDIVRSIIARRPVQIRNPNAVRPWQHVLEPLSGYLVLAERLCADSGNFASAWNFGPLESDARPVAWIVERLASVWGDGFAWNVDEGDHPHESAFLMLDIKKAQAELGYSPRVDLGTALTWVAEWYDAFLSKKDLRKLTGRQIAAFSELAS
jgi:CDP-glucose 4,6-dehydratase